MTRAVTGALSGGTSTVRPMVVVGVGLAVAAVGVAVATALVGHRTPGMAIWTDGVPGAVATVTAGASLALAGLESWRRGRARIGLLLVVTALAWFAAGWPYPTIRSDLLFTIGLGLGHLFPAVGLHVVVTTPSGLAPAGLVRRVVAAGYVVFGGVLGLLPALTFQPRDALCGLCPANHLAVFPSAELAGAASRLGTIAAAAWAIGALVVLLRRHLGLSPASRRLQVGTVIGGTALLVTVGLEAVVSALRTLPPTDPLAHQLRFAQALALVGTAGGVALEWLLARRSKERIAEVVAELMHTPQAGELKEMLSVMLGDPALEIGYPIDTERYADATGRFISVDTTDVRSVTPIVRDGSVVAMIDHRADVLGEPSQVDDVVAVARLGLEHERLQAVARARLNELRDARRRIVAAGDETRRRLERDLHDGAQQRLLAVAVELRLIRSTDPLIHGLVADAIADVNVALEELRTIAHGLYPAILADEGLAAALEGLAEGASVPVTLDELPSRRVDADAEASAYYLVAEAVGMASSPLRLACRTEDQRIVVEIVGTRPPPDVLEDLADRLGAVGSRLEHGMAVDGEPVLRADIPCGS